MKLICLLALGIFAYQDNLEESIYNFEKPSYTKLVTQALKNAFQDLNEHWEGFLILCNTIMGLGKQRNRIVQRIKREETVDFPIENSYYDSFSRESRLLADNDSSPVSNYTFNQGHYFGMMMPYLFLPGNSVKYYIKIARNIQYHTDIMEKIIPYPSKRAYCTKGFPVDVTYNMYLCNEQYVTKKNYEKLSGNSANNCYRKKSSGQICYCRRDAYGHNCESQMPIYCDHELITPNRSELLCSHSAAKNTQKEYYDDSRYGLPPCIFIGESRTLDMKMRLKCESHPLSTEGVKTFQDYIVEDLSNISSDFKYWINTSNLCISHPINITSALSFLNFHQITNQHQLVHNLSSREEITGKTIWDFHLDFKGLEQWRYGGRWYFELVAAAPLNYFILGSVTRAVIDDALYHEPESDSYAIVWIIALVILSILVGIGLIVLCCCWKYRKAKKEKEFLQDNSESFHDLPSTRLNPETEEKYK